MSDREALSRLVADVDEIARRLSCVVQQVKLENGSRIISLAPAAESDRRSEFAIIAEGPTRAKGMSRVISAARTL